MSDRPLRRESRGRSPWVACLAVFLTATATARAEEPLPTGTLSGRVVDPDGKPLAGARVATDGLDRMTRSQVLLAEARTGADGRFRLGPVAPFLGNTFEVTVDAEGFAREYLPPCSVSVFPGLDTEVGEVRVVRGRVFTGRAVDEDGRPRPGATVSASVFRFDQGHFRSTIGAAQSVTTDGDGRFRTAPLPVANLLLTVRAEDRQTVEISRSVRPGGEEDLGEIRLQNDVPFSGHVVDEEGRPVEGAKVVAFRREVLTDGRGAFTFRGLGPETGFWVTVKKDGYANQVLKSTLAMVVTLVRQGVFEGRAVDDNTGKPVLVVMSRLRSLARKPDGRIELSPANSVFEQREVGQFRATYPAPGEYKLIFSAAGYDDAEAILPKVEEAVTLQGVVVRMKKTAQGQPGPVKPWKVVGTVTRDGRPVPTGLVGLLRVVKPVNAPDAYVRRGRTVIPPPYVLASVPIRDGSYAVIGHALVAARPGWDCPVVVQEPGRPPSTTGPITVIQGEETRLDIDCTAGGVIRGRVKGVPAGWEGHVWVIAFGKSGVYTEARVAPDGSFTLPPLPPGEYGLKAGHDAYEDAETYPGLLAKLHPESSGIEADPWKRAKVVKVEPGKDVDGVEVEWPQ